MVDRHFADKIQSVADRVRERGVAIEPGFNGRDWAPVLRHLAARIGTAVSYFGQDTVMDIKPSKNKNCGGMSFAGTLKFPLHTDLAWYRGSPRYLAMFCVHPGEGGGDGVYADGSEAAALLNGPDLAELENTPLHFPAPSHVDWTGHTGPVIGRPEADSPAAIGGAGPRIRFNLRDIDQTVGGPARRFAEALEACAHLVPMRAGLLMVYDNHRFCHGRTAIQAGTSSRRFLKRMYIEPLPAALQTHHGQPGHRPPGGTRTMPPGTV